MTGRQSTVHPTKHAKHANGCQAVLKQQEILTGHINLYAVLAREKSVSPGDIERG